MRRDATNKNTIGDNTLGKDHQLCISMGMGTPHLGVWPRHLGAGSFKDTHISHESVAYDVPQNVDMVGSISEDDSVSPWDELI